MAAQKKQRWFDYFLDCHGAFRTSQGRVEGNTRSHGAFRASQGRVEGNVRSHGAFRTLQRQVEGIVRDWIATRFCKPLKRAA